MKEIAENHFGTFVKYHRGIAAAMALTQNPRDYQTRVHVLWGPPGVGKSRAAYELARGSDGGVYTVDPPRCVGGGVWWDGYAGEHTVVIDEFRGWIMNGEMCRLIDRYPMRVETKGGRAQFTAKLIIITSNYPPDMWYRDKQNGGFRPLGALTRRLEEYGEVIYMGSETYPTQESYKAQLAINGVPDTNCHGNIVQPVASSSVSANVVFSSSSLPFGAPFPNSS